MGAFKKKKKVCLHTPCLLLVAQFGTVQRHPCSTLSEESAAQTGKVLSLKESTLYSNTRLRSKQHILGILEEDYSSLFHFLQVI